MRELSLFTGAGGGLLATQHLLGMETVGYVEWDTYCQQVLEARIKDGLLCDAPIYGDIRAFIHRRGHARAYQGLVDIITAGFPCPAFSVAGKRRADLDERDMWPATRRTIGIVRPQWCLLENVPGLLSARGSDGRPYFGRILGDLASLGYDARWGVLSAADCGAPHLRKRLWIVAHAISERWGRRGEAVRRAAGTTAPRYDWTESDFVAYPPQQHRAEHGRQAPEPGWGGEDVADTDSERQPQSEGGEPRERGWVGDGDRGRLNPEFVEWLMGWMRGWTSLEPMIGVTNGQESPEQ